MGSALTNRGHAVATRAAVAAAVAAACAGAPAATVSASLQNFTITVEDLDLNDGVDAGFTFTQTEQVTFASLLMSDGQSRARSDFRVDWDPSTIELNEAGITTSASAGEGFMTASGSGLQHNAQVYRKTQLLVAPHTRLTFTGDVTVSTRIDSSRCDAGCESGVASFWVVSDAVAGETFALRGLTHNFDPPDLLSGELNFSHANEFDHARLFSLQMVARTDGGIGPIPEPQTYALMLAGLALCAWVARNRTPASQQTSGAGGES